MPESISNPVPTSEDVITGETASGDQTTTGVQSVVAAEPVKQPVDSAANEEDDDEEEQTDEPVRRFRRFNYIIHNPASAHKEEIKISSVPHVEPQTTSSEAKKEVSSALEQPPLNSTKPENIFELKDQSNEHVGNKFPEDQEEKLKKAMEKHTEKTNFIHFEASTSDAAQKEEMKKMEQNALIGEKKPSVQEVLSGVTSKNVPIVSAIAETTKKAPSQSETTVAKSTEELYVQEVLSGVTNENVPIVSAITETPKETPPQSETMAVKSTEERAVREVLSGVTSENVPIISAIVEIGSTEHQKVEDTDEHLNTTSVTIEMLTATPDVTSNAAKQAEAHPVAAEKVDDHKLEAVVDPSKPLMSETPKTEWAAEPVVTTGDSSIGITAVTSAEKPINDSYTMEKNGNDEGTKRKHAELLRRDSA